MATGFLSNGRCVSYSSISRLGNVAVVDAIYGNDSNATVGGSCFKTINAAVSAVSAGQTVWILPGTYSLTSGITMKNGTSLRGLSLQTTTIQMDVTGSTTMIIMGENCRIEDLTINLTCTGNTDEVVLKGIVFGGTSSQTSKLRTSVINIRNSTTATSNTSTVTAVEFSGTGTLNSSSFSFNSLKGSTINVYSNGRGNKRGIFVSGSNQASTRDLNIFVAKPTDSASTGSYVCVETNNGSNIGSIQMRSTTLGTVLPVIGEFYTASDILQTTPSEIMDPTYLASAGIQIGPGTDLVTKSAGGKGFTTYVYPTIIYYGLRGNITSGPSGGFLWPGTQTVSAGQYPDAGIPAAYFRAQQPTIISGFSVSTSTSPGGTTNTLTAAIYYSPASTTRISSFNGYINGTTLIVSSGLVGTPAVGQTVSGPGLAINTYIVAGSDMSWTVFPSQNVGSSLATIAMTTGSPSSSFVGKINNGSNNNINGTVLTITPPITGELCVGQYVAGTGVTAGTFISASTANPNVWTVSISQNVAPDTTIYSNGLLATPFTVTFQPTDTQKTFYNASHRLNTGDRIHLFVSYTSGSPANAVHDITAQIDLF